MTPAPPPLLALSPGTLAGPPDVRCLVGAARQAFAAGLPGLLLREPGLDERGYLALARELCELARGFGGRWLGLHDRLHVARVLPVDGLHLGFRSLRPGAARELLPPSVAVGFSAHASDVSEDWEAADYLTFGPLRETPSKQGLLEPVGLEGLERAAQRSDRPVLAIGGVRPEDVQPAMTAGAAGVAVLSGILGAEDVARATESYLRAEDRRP